jgi:hypothetical protein
MNIFGVHICADEVNQVLSLWGNFGWFISYLFRRFKP